MYRLTPTGVSALRTAVRGRLAHPRQRSGDFELALANLPVLSSEEAREALQTYRTELTERLAAVQAKWQADRAGMQQAGLPFPAHVDALFSRSLAILQAELEWVSAYLLAAAENAASPVRE